MCTLLSATLMPESPGTCVMSISTSGEDSRRLSVASRLCPPASSFAPSPWASSNSNTSDNERALT